MRKTALLVSLLPLACGGRTMLGGPPQHDGGSDRGVVPLPDRGVRPPDRGVQPPDRGWPAPDRALPPQLDQGVPCSTTIGTPCSSQSQCCGGLTCAKLPTGVGICTKPCTPDDPSTPLVNEDNCPGLAKHVCVNVDYPAGSHYCLQQCSPALNVASCPAGLACDPRSNRVTRNPKVAVCLFRGCTTPQDCPVRRAEVCNLAAPGPQCVGLGTGVFCAPDDQGGVQGKCALPGSCDMVSGLCEPHGYGDPTAKVGDPCKSDLDCGAAMTCDQQRGSGTQIHARNGYCTVDGCAFASTLAARACPAGSTCNHISPGGRCFKTCDLQKASDCRGHAADKLGDYECYDWSVLAVGSTQVAQQPTCEPADSYPCTTWQGSPLDCTYLGIQPDNPTKMQCRDRLTGAALPSHSPTGFCLDTTASGN